jgi:hypothetical protein
MLLGNKYNHSTLDTNSGLSVMRKRPNINTGGRTAIDLDGYHLVGEVS